MLRTFLAKTSSLQTRSFMADDRRCRSPLLVARAPSKMFLEFLNTPYVSRTTRSAQFPMCVETSINSSSFGLYHKLQIVSKNNGEKKLFRILKMATCFSWHDCLVCHYWSGLWTNLISMEVPIIELSIGPALRFLGLTKYRFQELA